MWLRGYNLIIKIIYLLLIGLSSLKLEKALNFGVININYNYSKLVKPHPLSIKNSKTALISL
jgi:uncharacterized membrane protein (Fun14 family)